MELSAAFEVTANIDGLRETTIGAHLSRASLKDGRADFYIAFDGRRFNIESNVNYSPIMFEQEESYEFLEPKLTITNRDGVILEVTSKAAEPSADLKDNISGSLIYNGTVYGTIERVKGLVFVRYIDGTGETLQ